MSMGTGYINPVDFMQDVIINQGTQVDPTNDAERDRVFRQMLTEEIFLRDYLASNNDSIFRPEPEEGLPSMTNSMSAIYGHYMRKQLAENIVDSGFLEGAQIDDAE